MSGVSVCSTRATLNPLDTSVDAMREYALSGKPEWAKAPWKHARDLPNPFMELFSYCVDHGFLNITETGPLLLPVFNFKMKWVTKKQHNQYNF